MLNTFNKVLPAVQILEKNRKIKCPWWCTTYKQKVKYRINKTIDELKTMRDNDE